MKSLLSILLLAPTLMAQEVTPQIAEDLASVLGTEQAAAILSHEKALGKAFSREVYQRVGAEILRSGQELPKPEQSDCPEAAALANEALHLYAGDFDPETVLAKTEEMLQRTDRESRAFEREMMQLHFRLQKAYAPILRAREQQREKDLLAANALRSEVTVLDNGIQYEIEPGDDSIRDITRGTTEIGILQFSRETDDTSFNDLPDCLKAMADKLPRAKSWTIYIPGEVQADAAEAKRREAEETQDRREDKLRDLLGAKPKTPTRKRKADKLTAPLLKLHLWKDDPEHPVKVQPDVHPNVL